MNEGKPTKAKWWSRPRAHGPGADTAGDHIGTEGPDGLTGPTGAMGSAGARDSAEAVGLGGAERADGAARTAGSSAGTSVDAVREQDTEGDFELAGPAAGAAPRARSSSASGQGHDPDGDFELERPAATAVAAARVPDGPGEAAGASSAPGAPSGRPRPLHDPDPYSTPPYGEPGPWAPAPPVQHPAATPAHGTAVETVIPAHAAPAPAHDETAPPAAVTHTGAAVASSATPPPASAPHADAPTPGTAAQPEAAPPVTAPYAQASGPAPAPYADSTQPPGASYAYPSQPGPPAFGDSAQAVPPPYAGGPQPAPAAYAEPARPHPAEPQGPWRTYDPWAGSGSLQQNGAAVDDLTRRRRRGRRGLLAGAVLIALVAGGFGGAVGAYLERNGGVGAVELPQSSDGVTARAPGSVAAIAADALPGVVTLHVSGSSAQGTGTGFVLDGRGHILTNNHVVDPAGTNGDISVTFSGGETAKATVVGRDTGYDLAVVKVSGVNGLEPLPLGNSEEVRVGDPVVAIGAPFDLANTVTSGIISAKERPITAGGESGDVSDVSYVDALQTDAPINPGNSGGPLLDGKGRVIGINSAIRSAGGGSESDGGQAGSIGLGFAIPINQGKRVAEELINTGRASHPVIGVTLDMDYSGDGARIGDKGDGGAAGVTAGGPADRAGIRSGDVITEVDGQRVHSGDELIVKVRAHRPGDRLELTLLRGGDERTVTLTLGSSGDD
ncbi:trypsin-like peptidase domain-containing protein [Streptomyces scabiei]|uniref:trypsin-like peptidase domain-containing protein n=1 Tax=Streptomyces scabiei TaxID=1930 RepID=UPI001FF0B731|nr:MULTISPECIES: trypsin-like peptidase domain-containing protein [Streptomyces]MDW8475671.1 trypsin-like peptidase domain-containing protein [Streptomyces scabiei]MDX2565945.1 trypsin-like peptidase domain-containing protein [Streptomyces scabiei]MDX2626205.1 trypsin-like peptidase domain-containing protein [Streptomyces scabiei]MDX3146925.1 trypsin-like peptidase domain-containing protein [Streptomyces scabiei]MDX3155670.1 trypsin-like peptidase domain-containing protein [Streptomyces scabie